MGYSGVYAITNVITGEQYIGSTSNLSRRSNDHFSALRRNKGRHPRLQANWNEYGEAAFEFKVLERVPDLSELKDREQVMIDRLQPALNSSMNSKGAGAARWETLRRRKIEDGVESKCYHRFLLTSPTGVQMCTDNLGRFAAYFGLERANLQAVAAGKIRSSKGWRCESIDNPRELKSIVPGRVKSKKYRGYLLTSPEGVQVCTDNLTAFCNEFELTRENLLKVARGQRKSSQGWTCEFIMG